LSVHAEMVSPRPATSAMAATLRNCGMNIGPSLRGSGRR
jgi:hypothetical protein